MLCVTCCGDRNGHVGHGDGLTLEGPGEVSLFGEALMCTAVRFTGGLRMRRCSLLSLA